MESEVYTMGIRIMADPLTPADMFDCPEGQICADGQCIEPVYQLTEEEHKKFDSIDADPEEIENAKKVYAKLRGGDGFGSWVGRPIHVHPPGRWSPTGPISGEPEIVDFEFKL